MNDKLAEKDEYMKQKVASQLDRLVGVGNYVVTVSTQLREAPQEYMVQQYKPEGAVMSSQQNFSEQLDTNGGGSMGAGGPASSFLPGGMNPSMGTGGNGKNYNRSGKEISYNNSKEQWIETRPVGMIEDVSIAVTIDSNHFPRGFDMANPMALQTQLARAASPEVNPEHVSIVTSDIAAGGTDVMGSAGGEEPQTIPWWLYAGGAISVLLLFVWLFSLVGGRKQDKAAEEEMENTMRELQELRSMTSQQQMQLQATQQQTQLLIEAQQRLATQPQQTANEPAPQLATVNSALQQTLDELKEVVGSDDMEDDNLDMQIKSWIESS